MDIGTYWVGQVPKEPLVITVYDHTGSRFDLSPYTSARLLMRGARNALVDTNANGGRAEITNATAGEVTYHWPTTSLFTRPGDYQVQIELLGPDVRTYTGVQNVVVRQTIGGN